MTDFDQRFQHVEHQYNAGRDINIVQHIVPLSPQDRRQKLNRDRMLDRVRSRWITNFLEKPLSGVSPIELWFDERPDLVDNPWGSQVQELNRPALLQQSTSTITQVYDSSDESLLILGEPGTGKTTLLLELARDLLNRAQQDEAVALPVVFNLASWAVKRQSITTWLVEELNIKYQVPRKVGQLWVATDQIQPLLDGLDEVAPEHRAACIDAINTFRQKEHGMVPLVVCCRYADYLAQTTRLVLQGAIVIKSLTTQQIDEYLSYAEGPAEPIRTAIHNDPALQELVATPLMLGVLTLAYQNSTESKLLEVESPEAWQQQVFAVYIKHMMGRRGVNNRYKPQQMMHWLTWLAQQMLKHSQSEFYIERMQPTWLPALWRYRLSFELLVRIIIGLFCGVIGLAFFGIIIKFFSLPAQMVFPGLFFGLVAGQLIRVEPEIKPAEVISWSWRTLRQELTKLILVGVGLVVAFLIIEIYQVLASLLFHTVSPVAFEVTEFLFCWFCFIFINQSSDRPPPSKQQGQIPGMPRHRFWQMSWKNFWVGTIFGLINGLVFGLICSLLFGLLFAFIDGQVAVTVAYLSVGSLLGGLAGLISGVFFGLFINRVEADTSSLRAMLQLWKGAGYRIGHFESLRSGILFGLLFGFLAWLFVGPAFGIGIGAILWILSGFVFGLFNRLVGGLSSTVLDKRRLVKPLQGIRNSVRNSILVGLIFGLLSGVIFGVIGGLAFGASIRFAPQPGTAPNLPLIAGLVFGMFGAFIGGLIVGLVNGGIASIQFFVLRSLLRCARLIPGRYTRFLNYATERIFLYKIGGGYIFVHRLLLEYFAALPAQFPRRHTEVSASKRLTFPKIPFVLARIFLSGIILTLAAVILTSSAIYSYPPSQWKTILNDPLTNEYHWFEQPTLSSGGACAYVQAGYEIEMTQPGKYFNCNLLNANFADFAFEVHMTILTGDYGGIIFRYDPSTGASYHFRISQDGSYLLKLYMNMGRNLTIAAGSNPTIHKGLKQTNVLAITVLGNAMNLYINHQFITTVTVQPGTVPAQGQIGVSAIDIKNPTSVLFNDARAWTGTGNSLSESSLADLHSYPPSHWPLMLTGLRPDEHNLTQSVFPDAHSDCGYVNTGYQVSIGRLSTSLRCFVENSNFTDMAFEVQMTILRGDYGGILFHYNPLKGIAYYCIINQNGLYAIGIQQKNSVLLSNGTATSFNRGVGKLNVIAIVTQGNTIFLYINHRYIVQINDPYKLSSTGYEGVIGSEYSSPTDILFTHTRIWVG